MKDLLKGNKQSNKNIAHRRYFNNNLPINSIYILSACADHDFNPYKDYLVS